MSDYLDPNNEELLKDFFDEAQAQVDVLEQNILSLENNPNDSDAVDEIFRAAHTLKGAAATVQMQELAGFTHTVEDVLDQVREGKVRITADIVDTLLASIDVIKAMLEARSRSQVYDGDYDSVANQLRSLAGMEHDEAAGSGPAPEPAAPEAAASGNDTDITEYELLEMHESAGADESVYRVIVHFDEANPMNTVGGIQVFAALKEYGSVAKSVPDFDNLYEDIFYPTVEYYLVSSADPQELRTAAAIADVTTDVDVQQLGTDDLSLEAEETQSGSAAEDEQQSAPDHDSRGAEGPADTDQTESEQVAGDGDTEAGDATEDKPETKPEGRPSAPKPGSSGSILRVDSRRIDNLLNLVSEAVINKATFNQITQVFSDTHEALLDADELFQERMKSLTDDIPDMIMDAATERKTDSAIRAAIVEQFEDVVNTYKEFAGRYKNAMNQFRNTAQNLGRITGELQEGVMQIRMVPISQIFSRFPRLVRDVSKNLNKQVELTVEGEETELDKSVIEDLLDPLIHCVRNSVDHGIETPAEREKAGKDPIGHVYLRANNEGNLIVIEISDDGKGIDVQKVRQRAIERKLIHPSKQLTDMEAFGLIFEPGFSTAQKVTDISGRGVGLDVVKRQIEKINGNVTVWSELGKGTKITIKLPLTLAILQGLLVRVGKEVYAIPITSVLESHRIKTDEIRFLDNYEVMDVREEVISLLRLDTLFRIPTEQDREQHFIVIVGTEENKVGLIVDSLIGEEDVVIKPLNDRFVSSPGIAGATILGDGNVALIIDVSQLLDLGMEREQAERQQRARSIV